ncbi:hypothetical protein [cf. Phormidesmis sp. LEGE 11477]|uniref:hypothetical protein n=1 Tax=cf. Phormidesmis sp. LEGE 11477 TaxID=1828680 RepID=UPI00188225E0|nr:hypothetical protein [cf. Phormidesmis sp. LEGE 11477]MBE9059928.1 hypothetical protein [cf. Phormidesmis sp. LEGE 11477]
MVYIITLVIGLSIGGGLAWVCSRRYWTNRLRKIEQVLFTQYSNDVQRETQKTLEAVEKQRELRDREYSLLSQNDGLVAREAVLLGDLELAKQRLKILKKTYEARLSTEQQEAKQAYHELQERYEGELIEKQCECTNLRIERDDCKRRREANTSIFFKEHEALEQRNQSLIADQQQLTAELASLRKVLSEKQIAYERDRELAAQKLDIDFGKIVADLFPDVELLRDSKDQINRNKSDFSALLFQIQALNNGDVSHSKKIRATHGVWSECRTNSMGMMRIYYRKAKDSGRYEVLVSRKHSDKSQKHDIKWLKAQPN